MGASGPAAPNGVRNSVVGLVSIALAVTFIILLALWLQRRKARQVNPLLPTGTYIPSSSVSVWNKVKSRCWPGAGKKAASGDEEMDVGGKEMNVGVARPPPTFLVTRPTTMGAPSLAPEYKQSRYYAQ